MTYRDEVLRTAGVSPHDSPTTDGMVTMGALGLVGEAGEVADEIKKVVYHKKPVDKAKMLKELGDVRWYLEYLAICYGFTMDEIEFANVSKLRERYPNGFTEHEKTRR